MTDQQTRHKILNAAAELFVQGGFQKTTVRQICKAAQVNVSAINYHFGDKKGLYEAVLQHAMELKPKVEDPPGATPEERLNLWVEAMVFSCVGEEPDLLSQLMALEMNEPTESLAMLVEQMVIPKFSHLETIIEALLGRSGPETRMLAMSVVGQVLFYHHSRPVINLMMPDMDFSQESLTGLVEHITRASVAMAEIYKITEEPK